MSTTLDSSEARRLQSEVSRLDREQHKHRLRAKQERQKARSKQRKRDELLRQLERHGIRVTLIPQPTQAKGGHSDPSITESTSDT